MAATLYAKERSAPRRHYCEMHHALHGGHVASWHGPKRESEDSYMRSRGQVDAPILMKLTRIIDAFRLSARRAGV